MVKKIIPVTVRGHRRLFNLRPTHYETSFKLHSEPIENGAMNVEPAPGAVFNGLAFTVSEEEIKALDQRERYYKRHKVALDHFGTNDHFEDGFVYISEPDAAWIERAPQRLMPLWRDIVWARDGAYRIGDDFGRCFDETTFLADGKTLVVDVYRHVLDDIGDVEMPE